MNSKYIDGFLLPLAKDKIETYREIATKAAAIWKEHGALEYVEAIGEDLDVKDVRPFPQAADAKENETVVLAYIVYESREHRDAVNAKVMADPRMNEMCPANNPDAPLPFDCARMAYGGFKSIVTA